MIGSGSTVTSELLIRASDAVLHNLVTDTGETAVVMRRVGLSAVCLHQVESPQGLRVVFEPGATLPLHAGAVARTLLAYAQPDLIDEVVARGLEAITSNTLTTEAALRETLADIQARGIARSEGELISGSVGIAAPVFHDRGIVGAVGVVGPMSRCGLAWRTRVARLLPEAANAIRNGLEVDGTLTPATIR